MNTNYSSDKPLFKIPSHIELILFLLRIEIKHRKFTSAIHSIGFDPNYFNLDFSAIILSTMGLDSHSDRFYEWYFDQLDESCKDLDVLDGVQLSEKAFNFYIRLAMERQNVVQGLT